MSLPLRRAMTPGGKLAFSSFFPAGGSSLVASAGFSPLFVEEGPFLDGSSSVAGARLNEKSNNPVPRIHELAEVAVHPVHARLKEVLIRQALLFPEGLE